MVEVQHSEHVFIADSLSELAASELFGCPSTGACSLSAIVFGQGFICADSAAQYIKEDIRE